jgi:putative membrane protein
MADLQSKPGDSAMPAGPPVPDYRYSLANERTYLAYVRTSLALFAGGTAILGFFDNVLNSRAIVVILGTGLYALGVYTAAASYRRWRQVDRAMRASQPMPPTLTPSVLSGGLLLLAVIAFVAVVAR